MSNQSVNIRSTKLPVRVGVLVIALMTLSLGSSEATEQKCRHKRGRFVSQMLIPPPECTSPLGACVSGKAIGGLRGNFLATGTSFTPSLDFAVTAVAFVTADLVLHTKDGDLLMKEAAATNINPDEGDLGDVVTIIGGTGKWLGATGRLRVWGQLSVSISDVRYEGEVCRP